MIMSNDEKYAVFLYCGNNEKVWKYLKKKRNWHHENSYP